MDRNSLAGTRACGVVLPSRRDAAATSREYFVVDEVGGFPKIIRLVDAFSTSNKKNMKSLDFEALQAAFSVAAIDPAGWRPALDMVARQTESFGVILMPTAGVSPLSTLPISEGMEEPTDAYFRGRWHLHDERIRGAALMAKAGVCDDLDLFGFDQIKRNPYYQEFLAPVGLRWFAGVNVNCGSEQWCLSIQRSSSQDPFSPSEKSSLRQLSTIVSSATSLAQALGFASSSAALNAFEVSGTAALLFDRSGHIRKLNQPAEDLLTGDVSISHQRLVCVDGRASKAFDAALNRAVLNQLEVPIAPVLLPRRGRRPLFVQFVRLSSLADNAFVGGQVIAIVTDTDARRSPPETILSETFQLTPSEARLASKLASGDDLDSIAAGFGLSKETLRNQLKAIFAKTGTRRQGELIAMLAGLPVRKP